MIKLIDTNTSKDIFLHLTSATASGSVVSVAFFTLAELHAPKTRERSTIVVKVFIFGIWNVQPQQVAPPIDLRMRVFRFSSAHFQTFVHNNFLFYGGDVC